MQNYKSINIAMHRADEKTVISRIIPILLIFSFAWLNLYPTLTNFEYYSNSLFLTGDTGFLTICLSAVFYYLFFELGFLVYRLCLSFSIYSYMIPVQVLKDNFRLCYCVRNILLGAVLNLKFIFPFIAVYSCVFELLFDMLLVVLLFFVLRRKYIEPLVAQFMFRTLAMPIVVYEIYIVIRLMVGVL